MEIRTEFRKAHPDIAKLLESEQYAFLNTDEHLGDRIILLGLGGSWSYGTNVDGSDVDVRGIALNSKSDLLGTSHFDTYTDPNTDTTIYGVNKYFDLLVECNPNIVEFLGLNDEDYIYIHPLGQMILDHKNYFISQHVYHSFGGYAYAQLKRLQNATARDSLSDEEREKHILHSVEKQLENIRKDFSIKGGNLNLYIADAVTDGHKKEILMDGHFECFPLRSFNMMYNAMNQVCKDYDHLDHRNRKKDDQHLNKHAMHLIRLYSMAEEMLLSGEIHTKRVADHDLLMAIRNGEYMQNSIMTPEFFALVDEHKEKLEEAMKNTVLPKKPDMNRIEDLLIRINEESLRIQQD